jgi:hypothetical protein
MQIALLLFEHSKIDLFVPNKMVFDKCLLNALTHHKLQYLHAIIIRSL